MDRKKGLDFVRMLSAMGIICFHFYCHSSSSSKLFYSHANGSWGGTINYLFFALSGLCIHMKYGGKENFRAGKFYYNRWKSMMPAYMIVWAFAYFLNVCKYGDFFYLDIPKSRVLLTLIGMDGYLSSIIQTYYIAGEWFFGAILIAYMAYPVLRAMFIKNRYLTVIGMFILYEIRLNITKAGLENVFMLIPERALATCLFSFTLGMLIATEFEKIENRFVVTAAAFLAVLGLCVPVSFSSITKEIVIGCLLLIVLNAIGEAVCVNKRVYKGVFAAANLSFYTFLLHHMLIYKVLGGFDTNSPGESLIILVCIVFITLLFSKILKIVMDSLMRSSLLMRIDKNIDV